MAVEWDERDENFEQFREKDVLAYEGGVVMKEDSGSRRITF